MSGRSGLLCFEQLTVVLRWGGGGGSVCDRQRERSTVACAKGSFAIDIAVSTAQSLFLCQKKSQYMLQRSLTHLYSGSWMSPVEESRACYLSPVDWPAMALENQWKLCKLLFLSPTLVGGDFSITWPHQTDCCSWSKIPRFSRQHVHPPASQPPVCRGWDNEAKLPSRPGSFFSLQAPQLALPAGLFSSSFFVICKRTIRNIILRCVCLLASF